MAKTYKNTGTSTLRLPKDANGEALVVEPGDSFTGDLDPTFESQMLAGVHLTITSGDEPSEAPVALPIKTSRPAKPVAVDQPTTAEVKE